MGGGNSKNKEVVQAQPPPPPAVVQQPVQNPPAPVPQNNVQKPPVGGATPAQNQTPAQSLNIPPGGLQKPGGFPSNVQSPAGTFQEEGEAEEDELNLATGGQNTFQGTRPNGASLQQPLPTPAGSIQNKNLLQSDQGAVLNRFKDSIDVNASRQLPQPAQNPIDAYQQSLKTFKSQVEGLTVGGSVQEEDEGGYGTVGGGAQSSFRTEQMTGQGFGTRQQSLEQQPVRQSPIGAISQMNQPITPSAQYQSQAQSKQQQPEQRASMQTAAGLKDSHQGFAGAMNVDQSYGGAGPEKLFESQRSPYEESSRAPYASGTGFPNFRQDSRPTFNVDFGRDDKPVTHSATSGYNQQPSGYTQQPTTFYGQEPVEQSFSQQQSMLAPSQMAGNFRQDTKISSYQGVKQEMFQGPPSVRVSDITGSIHEFSGQPNQSIQQNTMQQILSQTNRTQQQMQSSDGGYSIPTRKEPSVPSYIPVPKDQLLSQDQKDLLKLGQRSDQMQRKLEQPLVTKVVQVHNHEDEELGGYYNFDSGILKAENFAVKKPQAAAIVSQQQIPIKQMQQTPIQKQEEPNIQDQMSKTSQSLNKTQSSLQQQQQQQQSTSNQQPTLDELAYHKEQFLEQEERERLNPQNMLIRVMFIHAFNAQMDEEQAALEESRTDRRLYSFFIGKAAKVLEVKQERIKKEFGFDVDQIKLYFKYKELNNQQLLCDIEHYDIEEDILICVTINGPKTYIPAILRDPLDDIKIADVRLLNSRDKNDIGIARNDVAVSFEIANFDVNLDKLPWPVYRDWTAEAAYLSDIIVRNKQVLLSDEQQFLMQQGVTRQLHESAELAELAEAEAAFRKLGEEFKKACLYAVHVIVKKSPTPLNLFNLYGDDGDKFVVGGILIRRAKDWTICGQPFTDAAKLHTTALGPGGDSGSNLQEISGKIAALDVRNLSLLRNRLPRLVVPLGALVDYFGLRFECQSIAPLSINSLVYGSDTNGLVFVNRDAHAEAMARQIGNMLNLKEHWIEEQSTNKMKKTYLPYTVQLHRNKDLQEDLNLYLVNPFRLFPQDESLRQSQPSAAGANLPVPIQEIMSKQLRPELCLTNNKGEPDSDCQYFTWRRPTKCDECAEFINDYEYYYFEKKSVDKTQRVLVQYYCCISCYMERLPTESFKYPVNKISKKELPPKDRLQFYQNMKTGHRFLTMQFQRTPLNPDAYFHLSNGREKADKIAEQEEILRASQKLKDDILVKLLDEFNSSEVDPLDGDQMKHVMHNRGMNIRQLGKICTGAEMNHIRELCVVEVIARSAKLLIKDGLTFLADDEEAGFQTDNIKKCVLHYLLEIFHYDDGAAASGGSGAQVASAQNIWDFVTEHARKKFQVTVEKDILGKINMSSLLISLCQKLNLKLRRSVRDIDFFSINPQTGERNFLTIEDIESIIPVVKDYTEDQPVLNGGCKEEVYPTSLNIVIESARARDQAGKRSNWYMRGGEERDEATDLYRLAASICEQIYGAQTLKYARILKEFAQHLESRHQEKGRPENSRWNRSFAIVEDDLSSESRFFYNTALQTLKEIGADFSIDAAEIYVGIARLVKPRSAQFQNYREQDNSTYDVYQNLMLAVDIYEGILGFDHPETADAYSKMAIAYQEQGNSAAASPWIRRAFTVFFKSFGPYDPVTQSAYEQLKAIETNVDSKLDQVPFEELPAVIYEIEREQKRQQEMQMQVALRY